MAGGNKGGREGFVWWVVGSLSLLPSSFLALRVGPRGRCSPTSSSSPPLSLPHSLATTSIALPFTLARPSPVHPIDDLCTALMVGY